ncbi:MAG: hypothetical protein BLITH_0624 [Brockia lithotrophica]|uniref:Uncharacterized protein n=1 Tax=Brockia lithotrophica TaxID=933949 RepID=A0A2T5G8C1_9BACL|nr:MAG: hypothetical protein BLITH_0624 [Brockia lithotrophica]
MQDADTAFLRHGREGIPAAAGGIQSAANGLDPRAKEDLERAAGFRALGGAPIPFGERRTRGIAAGYGAHEPVFWCLVCSVKEEYHSGNLGRGFLPVAPAIGIFGVARRAALPVSLAGSHRSTHHRFAFRLLRSL